MIILIAPLARYSAPPSRRCRKFTARVWRLEQVLDHPELWQETSCTAMFAYSIARAVNRSWIDASHMSVARRAFAGLCANYITPEGVVKGTCQAPASGSTLHITRTAHDPTMICMVAASCYSPAQRFSLAANEPTSPALMNSLRWLDTVVIALYMFAMLMVGRWFGRRQTTSETYFVGGRSIPHWAMGISIYATVITSITFIAYPGSAYAGNWSELVPNLMVVVVLVVAGGVIIPFFRHAIGMSIYEYFENASATARAHIAHLRSRLDTSPKWASFSTRLRSR